MALVLALLSVLAGWALGLASRWGLPAPWPERHLAVAAGGVCLLGLWPATLFLLLSHPRWTWLHARPEAGVLSAALLLLALAAALASGTLLGRARLAIWLELGLGGAVTLAVAALAIAARGRLLCLELLDGACLDPGSTRAWLEVGLALGGLAAVCGIAPWVLARPREEPVPTAEGNPGDRAG